MNKIYQRPTLTELAASAQSPLLSNSLTEENNIYIDKDDMEGGDGSDGTKAAQNWGEIWD